MFSPVAFEVLLFSDIGYNVFDPQAGSYVITETGHVRHSEVDYCVPGASHVTCTCVLF